MRVGGVVAAMTPFALSAMLVGACNFRDIGGLPTMDGGRMRTGAVFRSNHLSSVTDQDRVILDSLGIAAIFDLRTRLERERNPTSWSSPDTVTHAFRGGHKRRLIDMAQEFPPTRAGALALMHQFYREMPRTMGHAFGEMIMLMSAGATPCVVYCSAGKDRTGVAIAILLAALGVARGDIIADYVRSASLPGLEADMARAFATARDTEQVLEHYPADALSAAMDASPDYIEQALYAIDDQFGSVIGYLDANGVPAKAVLGLRAILLGDGPPPTAPVAEIAR